MATNLGTIYAELGLRMDKFVQGAQQAKVHITKLEQRMESMQEASDMLSKGVLAVGTAMAAVGSYAIVMAAQMQQSEIAFGTLLGSGEKAKTFLKDLADFAAETPFELRGLQAGSRMLLAFGFQAQDIIPMMTAVGDAVAALGGGEHEIQRVVRALGQMQAKGRVSAEEMMQLAELGIPAWDMLAQEIGVSVPEAMDMARQGAIDGMAGVNAILAGMQGRFAGAMDEQSKTVIGMWSTITDNISLGAVHLGNVLIESFDIAEHMEAIIAALNEMRITLEAFSSVVQERGLQAAVVELFGPGTTMAILAVAGAITAGLIPSIYAATKALWLKFAALAALKPWLLLVGAAAGGLMAAGMIRQTEATQGSSKSLQEHIDELRRQATTTRGSTTQTDRFRNSLTRAGTAARTAGRSVADAAQEAQEAVRAATSRIDRLHDALTRALRRKYEQERDTALDAIDEVFSARRRALEAQLDLLDNTARQEDFHAEQGERKTKLSLLQRELAFETDARRRADIQNRIAEAEKEILGEQTRFDRETRRQQLRDQIRALGEEESAQRTSTENIWAQRLTEATLGAEAERLIIKGHHEEILILLKTYGDGWRDIGATFGQRLVEGMGPYPAELRRMVTTALADVQAAADGAFARLRQAQQAVAAAVPAQPRAPVQQPRAPVRQPAPVVAPAPVAPVVIQPERFRGQVFAPMPPGARRLPERELPPAGEAVRNFFRELREGVQRALRGPDDREPRVTVNVQNMNVRREEDVQAVSRQLHRHIQAGTRARGGR